MLLAIVLMTLSDPATELNNRAMQWKAQGRIPEAFAAIEECIAIREATLGRKHPDTLVSLSNLASLHGAVGNWKQAGVLYREVLVSRPRHADSLINVALIEKLEGNFSLSIAHLEEALALPGLNERTLIAAHNNLAVQRNQIGEGKLARQHVDRALGLTPPGHPTRNLILETKAAIELSGKHYREARRAASEAVQSSGDPQGRGAKLLAWVDFFEGDLSSAEARMAQVWPKLPRQPFEQADAHHLLAQIRLKQNRAAAALDHLEAGLTAARGNPAMLSLYARLLRDQQRYWEAAKADQQATTIETKAVLARTQSSRRVGHAAVPATK